MWIAALFIVHSTIIVVVCGSYWGKDIYEEKWANHSTPVFAIQTCIFIVKGER